MDTGRIIDDSIRGNDVWWRRRGEISDDFGNDRGTPIRATKELTERFRGITSEFRESTIVREENSIGGGRLSSRNEYTREVSEFRSRIRPAFDWIKNAVDRVTNIFSSITDNFERVKLERAEALRREREEAERQRLLAQQRKSYAPKMRM